VEKIALFLFLLSLSAYASPCIDFWGDGCREKKQVKEHRKETKKSKEEEKRKFLEKLYRESLNWTPDNLSPLEKYAATHPQDKEALKLLRKYLAERQIRACYLEKALTLQPTSECDRMRKEWERWVNGERGIPPEAVPKISMHAAGELHYLFFYSPTCPHCTRTLPVVVKVLGSKVRLIEANSSNADLFKEWKVGEVPTLIVYRGKRALKLTGEFNQEKLLTFLKVAAAKLLPDKKDSSLSVSSSQGER